MARILLIVEGRENRELLNAFLSAYHSVGEHSPGDPLEEAFDLCIVDGPSLSRFKDEIEARREAELPGIVPVLLITPKRDIWDRVPSLWQLVDESIVTPVSRMELQSRVEILLRTRRISQNLKLRNEDLEAFIRAMSHDLRASIRAVSMFAETVAQSQADRLTEEGKQDLNRIRSAAEEMRELVESLLSFSRVGRGEVRYEPIDLRNYIETCLRNLHGEIRSRNASIRVKGKAYSQILRCRLRRSRISAGLKFTTTASEFPRKISNASSCRLYASIPKRNSQVLAWD